MNENQLYILLDIVSKNSSVKKLVRAGLQYKDIANLLNKAISLELIYGANDKLELSRKGIIELEKLDLKFKETNKKSWIELDKKNLIPREELNFIYLPEKNSLNF